MNTQEHSDPFISKKANRLIWMSFIIFVVLLFISIELLVSYFKYEAEIEHYDKVSSVKPRDLNQLRAFEGQVLRGEVPLEEGEETISIEEAIDEIIKANYVRGQE